MTKPQPALRLSLAEREEISRGLVAKLTLTQIAAGLGRSVSTISREAKRNSGVNGYRAVRADRLATARTARARPAKLAADDRLRAYVEDRLKLCWSPQKIASRLRSEFPDDTSMRVSHETIYTSLFVQRVLGCAEISLGSCAPAVSGADRKGRSAPAPDLAGYPTWCRSESDRRKSSTGERPGIGRVISSLAATAARTWRRWSNDTAATSSCCPCLVAPAATAWSAR